MAKSHIKKSSPSYQSRLFFYLKGIGQNLYPKKLLSFNSDKKLILSGESEINLLKRVDYYNGLDDKSTLGPNSTPIKNISIKKSGSAYYYDFMEYARFFDEMNHVNCLFGDIKHIPEFPSIVKSRPISDTNANSVLLKLNKIRHFNFMEDTFDFRKKENKLIWRGACHQIHRQQFMRKFYKKSPLIDIGQHNKGRGDGSKKNPQWQVPYLSIEEQLKNKFIFSIEGNDVATNLKWAMASNSLCMMTKPKLETWFMEGKLVGNYHYAEVKEDYSDLEEKVEYYIDNPNEAEYIIRNANEFVEQFNNNHSEDWISYKVLERYFSFSK